jgi:hypothetical protein
MITATDWRPLVKNTLRGFCTFNLRPSGLVLRLLGGSPAGGKVPSSQAENGEFG